MIGFIIVMLMGGTAIPQPSMPDHLFADLVHNMGHQEHYNFWCAGVRCNEKGHGGFTGTPEDCTRESEENGSCGFGLQQP